MYCARHPNVETSLRCGKCDQPICPKCAIQTPVGARCPDCAKVTRLPVFQVAALDHLKAAGVGLVLAIVLGVIWGIADPYLPFFTYLTVLVTGYVIGEAASRAVNRKRGAGLRVIAGTSVFLSYGVSVAFGLSINPIGILALVVGIFVASGSFR